MRRTAFAALAAGLATVLTACGLTSGSPMVDTVRPGTIGKGRPLAGADFTVASKEFTEQLVLGAVLGIALEAAGAKVVDRTGIQGSFGARAAVQRGEADVSFEYTGTGWITYLGHTKPEPDPRKQWQKVHDEDLRNGLTWLAPADLNNTYALALNPANARKYGVHTLSDVAKLAKKDPGAVTLCVDGEFAVREDGLPGMERAYGMHVPASKIRKMDSGIVYTQVAKGACTFGEIFTTDGRVKALNLSVLRDDRHFFPNYNAAPQVSSATLKKYPAIRSILDPITRKLTNDVAQDLNGKVDVDGQDPHEVALDWLVKEGFVKR
ncbi:glycine betaine ABC transporter substrate-binding protein [Streptomyces sp. TS71-3]|uniref:glycine betaine ABC transporter substrate-binding protein n=1 Tax=Streptomyces sp. TS71-3 TaxID=2733862 RepID=UPI0035AC2291